MKSFFYSALLTLTLGLAFSGVSAHAQTAQGDINFVADANLGTNGSFQVIVTEITTTQFDVTVTQLPGRNEVAGAELKIVLWNGFGGDVAGNAKLDFASAPSPTGGTNGQDSPFVAGSNWTPSSVLDVHSNIVEQDFKAPDSQSQDLIDAPYSFTGVVNLQAGQDPAESVQVTVDGFGVHGGAGQGTFDFTPDGASIALIVPGLLPLGFALRRRRSSKAQA